ncbi:Gfo/Idh/MocA family protein [Jannaschia sp. 2305UL9-9]|uniref:Gfo/Idh/MocA family protein n=1 Tax=Jannaschia sp. 2305UL9-9 TaxID=3121638 RepID=UPI00352891F6
MTLKLGILGIDHGHIFGMLAHMLGHGCTCEMWWTDGPAVTRDKFVATYPALTEVTDRRRILDDPSIDMVLISAVPADRARLAIEAMEAGKDVMVDKPGVTDADDLARLRAVQARTGRIWSVNFSERFQVPAVAMAETLVAEGAIGRVVQVLGLGPHKQNLATRPEWFFDRARYGGILCDIGSHQIDQFLHFTGATDAKIAHALVENTTIPDRPGFQDFGEIVLRAPEGHGYIRVDWFTPRGLPTWGDGRLFLQGTEGQIELRKYAQVGEAHMTDQLFLVNGTENRRIDCRETPLPYFPRLIADVRDRSETAMPQAHAFAASALAIEAQAMAERAHG